MDRQRGKAKKSDGFWRCVERPKILAHLTSPRGDGGGELQVNTEKMREGEGKKKKNKHLQKQHMGEKQGKTSRS